LRVRTEAKRETILETAAQVFMELGFERTSMSEIAARLGGSKATLYSYFPSKDDLFLAVVQHLVGDKVDPAFAELPAHAGEDPRTVLMQLGEHVLEGVTTPESIAVWRMVVGQSAKSDIGQRFWNQGPQPAVDAMAAYLAAATAAGRLSVADPKAAALHLMTLWSAELDWRWMFGFQERFTRAEIVPVVARAVDAFLQGYSARGAA
jgi:AcrR family transcriptional regulator